MKNFMLLWLFFVLTFPSFAQNQQWAPIGAEWYYTHRYFIPPPPYFPNDVWDFNRVISVKDTSLGGKNCRQQHSEKFVCSMFDGNNIHRDYYTYQDSGKVYIWDSLANDFALFIDFNVDVGGSWRMPKRFSNTDTIDVYVDSVDYYMLTGDSLKQFHVSILDPALTFPMYAVVSERFGFSTEFAPFSESEMVCDGEYDQELRCYNDGAIGLHSFVSYACDSIITFTATDKIAPKAEPFRLYPNPAQNQLTIDFENYNGNEILVEIYNSTGQLLQQESIWQSSEQIEISHLSKGLFSISVQSNGRRYARRFIKQ